MKKSTLAIQGAASVTALGLIAALAQANSVRHNDLGTLNVDMAEAAIIATDMVPGDVVEAELEIEDAGTVWEIDLVSDDNKLVTIEVDGQTGNILSTDTEDDAQLNTADVISLANAINLVSAIEQGALIEAELEQEDSGLIWEIETLDADNKETTVKLDAQTGEIYL